MRWRGGVDSGIVESLDVRTGVLTRPCPLLRCPRLLIDVVDMHVVQVAVVQIVEVSIVADRGMPAVRSAD